MTTYRFHWRPTPRDCGLTGSLFVRVIHNRRFKDIARPYVLTREEWDPFTRSVKLSTRSPERKLLLRDIQMSMREDLSRLESIVYLLSLGGEYGVWDICKEFSSLTGSDTLTAYVAGLQRELNSNGRTRTARAYRSAAYSLTSFCGKDIALSEITPALIRDYENHLLDRGLKMNTVSFYMRNLRAVYYRGVKGGVITPCAVNPFADVFTGVYETRRRALDKQELLKLAALEKTLAANPVQSAQNDALKDSLQYFMFAFHARGMSFIDLAYLKKSEINGDTIRYKRKKTGYFIEVKITAPMRRIINHYKCRTKSSGYVFPIIPAGGDNSRLRYETGLTRQNRILKELAVMAGIGKNLSTHVARHTWATLAKRMGYNIPLISEGLGHRDIKVTATYLASFEKSALDELSARLSRIVKAA